MITRISGDTLATSDRVAMTPTVQPAATGTHQNAERRFLFPAGRVIGREDMRSAREMGETRYQTGPVYFSPGPCPGSSGAALDSRNANCSVFSPSRTGPACGPRY